MQNDPALEALIPYLQSTNKSTLWFADEQVSEVIENIKPRASLIVVTNRFDIYQKLDKYQFQTHYCDFDKSFYEGHYDQIIYRVSKEKLLVKHLLNQSKGLLSNGGKLVISGLKQEGIKSYADNLVKEYKAKGKLKKKGRIYLGEFDAIKKEDPQIAENYTAIKKITSETGFFYSKPGVYGWEKVDKGSALLLFILRNYFSKLETTGKDILDLGCGYGWLFLNLDKYGFNRIDATDNNLAAVECAKLNSALIETDVNVFSSDCANTIQYKYDFIVCNPPFHQGFSHKKSLTDKFIARCSKSLEHNGKALLVVNEFIGLSDLAHKYQLNETILSKNNGFKVVELSHNKTQQE